MGIGRAGLVLHPMGMEECLMFNSDDVLVPQVVEAGFDPFRARVAMGWLPGGVFR